MFKLGDRRGEILIMFGDTCLLWFMIFDEDGLVDYWENRNEDEGE